MGITNRSFSASPVRSKHSQSINTSLSFSNQDTQAMLNQLLPDMKTNDSFHYNSHLKASNSFDSELISTTKRPSRKKSSNETDYPLTRTYPHHASSIIHIIPPNLHLSSSSSILANPVLLTPDAFLNSPTNTSRVEQPFKNDMLQNLLINRTGSLTQVTAPIALPVPKAVNQNKILNKIHQRAHSSSISTSTSSSSSCFSCMHSIDQADKGTTSISVTKSNERDSYDFDLNGEWSLTDVIRDREQVKTVHKKPSDSTEIKNLLIQMNKTLNSQREEIEKLKRSQLTNNQQFKTTLDSSLKKFLNSQQQQPASNPSIEMQQSVINNLLIILEKLIKDEINKLVKSQFAQHLFEPLRVQISNELSDKLKTIENIFKDSAMKLFISKSTIDTLSQSVSVSLQSNIVNTYRETFQKLIVPNFEKSCQNMYQQVNSSFAKGTHDYLIEFDQLAKQHRKMFDENKEPLLIQMKKFSESMQMHGNQVANNISGTLQQHIESNLRNTNAILQDTIISSFKAIIKEELQLAMHDQQLTLSDILLNQIRQSSSQNYHNSNNNDQSNTSYSMHQDTQLQIIQHLKKGAINNAFQVALCAADLNLLENLCELVSPSQAFDAKSKLQQPVILSLIQQLSQDLNSNTELKLKYLEEAIVNLDLTVPLTIEHTPIVMNQLIVKLQQHIQMHPNDKSTKQCKMLLLASKSLNTQKQQPQQQLFGTMSSGLLTNNVSQQNKPNMLSFHQQ